MKYFWKTILIVVIILSGCVKPDDPFFTTFTTEDHDGPQLEHPFMTDQFQMFVYEFLDYQLLEHIQYVYPENLIEEFMEIKAELMQLDEPIEIVFIMKPGFGYDENFIQFNPQITERLTRPNIPFPSDGVYSLEGLQVVTADPEQSFITMEEVSAEEAAKAAKKGGICATLAIAHSLIRRLNNLIPKDATGDWKGVTKTVDGKEVWDADFLKAIYKATGDNDGKRGLTNEEIEKGHTADYSSNWKIRISKPMEEIKTDGNNLTNAQLAAKCESLKKMIEENRDDCLLRMLGEKTVDGEKKNVGHRMTITGVECANGSMKIKTINTGKQDKNKDWENVSYNPGEEEWEITPTGIKAPPHWQHIDWKNSYCTCFDEEPKDPNNPDRSRGVPGNALK